jgi:hypothetical protein
MAWRPAASNVVASMALNVLWVACGAALLLLTLNDLFQSVIVPRAVGRRFRISYVAWRWAWMAWPVLSWKLYPRDEKRRQFFLALFAPASLIGLLSMWAVLIILSFGLMFWGLRAGLEPLPHTFGETAYFAGSAMTTLGFGDIVGRSSGTRLLSVIASVTGLGFFAITTAYLFALFGAFQTRETFVVVLAVRSGMPPNGVNLLAIAQYSRTAEDLETLFADAQRWGASVTEMHMAYPVLAYFRSGHEHQSWIGTLGTLLDAATLLITTVDGLRNGQARFFYNLGRQATHDLAKHLGAVPEVRAPRIERGEFDKACDRLERAGLKLHERDAAWERFCHMRSSYAAELSGLARHFQIMPLEWVGDRVPVHPTATKAL